MKIFIIGSISSSDSHREDFKAFCQAMGSALAKNPVQLILCSPHEHSADIEIIRGITTSKVQKASIELHYPNSATNDEMWNDALVKLNTNVQVSKFRHEAAETVENSIKYSWLFCQIQAVSKCDFVIVLGGRIYGSSNLLVRMAEVDNKTIIPLSKFGGVGNLYFERKRYELDDVWGNRNVNIFKECRDAGKVARIIVNGKSHINKVVRKDYSGNLKFFISYSRERPSEADFTEMILRRRNFEVLRDENEFKSSEDIPSAIKERIFKSDVFIALWSKEYACSPWCFDELTLALENQKKFGKALWILRLDETRMVHPGARNLLWFDTKSRVEIESKILHLLTELS